MADTATELDSAHLRRALELAERGRGRVSPNPLVGAVLVAQGETIGEGFHAGLGGRHAEVAALEDCRRRGGDPAGATLYVTLEPCAHHGRQPPCTDAITAPGAPGDRIEPLRDAGVEVIVVGGSRPERVRSALAELGRREITSILLEGGPVLASAFFDAGEIDELRLFFAPRVLGGGRPLIAGAGAERMEDAQRALSVEWEQVGDDLLARARMKEW